MKAEVVAPSSSRRRSRLRRPRPHARISLTNCVFKATHLQAHGTNSNVQVKSHAQ